MAVLRSLVTTLGLNSAQFRAELKRSQRQYSQFSAFTKKASALAAKSIKGLTGAVFSMKTALVAVGSGAALYGLKQAYEHTADIKRQADIVGVAAGKWDAYTKAAKQVGVTGDQLSDVFKDLNVRITDAAKNGSGPLVDFFKQINQSAQDWADLAPDEQFKRFTEEINKMTETDARFWLDELNDASTSLLPSLVKNKGELQKLVNEVESLGLALTTAQMDQISQANKDMDALIVTTGGLWDQMKAAGAPAVSMVSQGIRDWLTETARAHGGFQALAKTIVTAVLGAVVEVSKAIESLLNNTYVKAKQIAEMMGHEFSGSTKSLELALSDAEAKYNAFARSLYGKTTIGNSDAPIIEFAGTDEDLRKLKELEKVVTDLRNQINAPFQFSGAVEGQVDSLLSKINSAQIPELSPPLAPPKPGLTTGVGGKTGVNVLDESGTDWLEQLKQQNMIELELISAHEKEKLDKAKEYHDKKLLTDEQYAEAKRQIEAKSAKDERKLLQSGLSSFTGVMGEMVGTQSSAYKVMFAATKAFNIAETMSAAFPAIAKAWGSAPFPYNMGAVATTTIETGALTAGAQAVQLAGMAHDGIDYIPREGTWLLNKGERVVDERTNADLKAFLSNQGGNNDKPANSPQWKIIIENAPEGTTASVDSVNEVVRIAVAETKKDLQNDMRRGGSFSRTGQQHLGWKRSASR